MMISFRFVYDLDRAVQIFKSAPRTPGTANALTIGTVSRSNERRSFGD